MILERKYIGKERYWKGKISERKNIGKVRCRKGKISERKNIGKVRYRKGKISERIDIGKDKYRKGKRSEKKYIGKELITRIKLLFFFSMLLHCDWILYVGNAIIDLSYFKLEISKDRIV